MKKTFLLLVAMMISFASFSQKEELKAAENALKANNFKDAVSVLKNAEPLLAAAKDKQKAQYYLLLGKGYNGQGMINDAASAFNKVIEIEKNGSKSYTDEAGNLLNTLVQNIATKASSAYEEGIAKIKDVNDKDTYAVGVIKLGESADGFKKVYELSQRDTAFLQNAAYIYYFAEKYNNSIDAYKKLIDMGYTGAGTTYEAISVLNDQPVYFNTKKEMDDQVKMKLAKNPKVSVKEPQTVEMKKMIVKNYIALKQNDDALKIIKEAQQAAPGDYGLLVDEANVYYAMGDNLKFKEKLEEAVKINPSDYVLHYNIGVMKSDLKDYDGAIESYNKAIELKPDYADAYNNIGAAILGKTIPIVEEMNQNLNNFKKYDELQAKQLEFYKQAMPYYEKAFGIDKNNISVVQALMGIYNQLEMYDKAKEMKVIYEQIK